MKYILAVLTILFITGSVFADEVKNKPSIKGVAEILAKLEAEDDKSFLKTWLDAEAIERLPQTHLADDYIKELYAELKDTIVTPPDPDTHEGYGIENGEEELIKVDRLGRLINTMLLYLPNEDIEKYGGLLWTMRDVLYLDLRHIPLAIKHDRSRDVYWHMLHTKKTKAAEEEYINLFGVIR